MWKGLFRELEERLLDDDEFPLSTSPERRDTEAAFLEMWGEGSSTSIAGVRRSMAERENGEVRSPTALSTVTCPTATHRMGMADVLLETSPAKPDRRAAPDAAARLHAPRLHPLHVGQRPGRGRVAPTPRTRHERVARDRMARRPRRCAVVRGHDGFARGPPRGGAPVGGGGPDALPVEMVGLTGQSYSATSTTAQQGEPFLFRLVIGRPSDLADFKRAWDVADQETIGDLLGYPRCCRDFSAVSGSMTPWSTPRGRWRPRPGADRCRRHPRRGRRPRSRQHPVALDGRRTVPHLPCRFDCPATVELGERFVAVGRSCGFGQEMDWLLDVLSWPVEWSALHGIAEIRTPLLKVSTRTDATPRRYTVQRRGDSYPIEGAQGLSFPFQAPVKLRLTGARGFQRGIEHSVAVNAPRPSWYATDNGFESIAAMEEAHRPIVTAAVAALAGRRRGGRSRVWERGAARQDRGRGARRLALRHRSGSGPHRARPRAASRGRGQLRRRGHVRRRRALVLR